MNIFLFKSNTHENMRNSKCSKIHTFKWMAHLQLNAFTLKFEKSEIETHNKNNPILSHVYYTCAWKLLFIMTQLPVLRKPFLQKGVLGHRTQHSFFLKISLAGNVLSTSNQDYDRNYNQVCDLYIGKTQSNRKQTFCRKGKATSESPH